MPLLDRKFRLRIGNTRDCVVNPSCLCVGDLSTGETCRHVRSSHTEGQCPSPQPTRLHVSWLGFQVTSKIRRHFRPFPIVQPKRAFKLQSHSVTQGTISGLVRAVLCGLGSDRVMQVVRMTRIEMRFAVLRRIAHMPMTACASAPGLRPDPIALPAEL